VLKRVSRVRERKVRKRVWVFIEGENVWGFFGVTVGLFLEDFLEEALEF
jgi:hypothetical protein